MYLQAHYKSHTSQCNNQSFDNELEKLAQEKNFKFFLPRFKRKKIKHANKQSYTDKKDKN